MNELLIFFALPIAVIIISIALQRILKCPWLVSAIIFAVFLIITFVVNNLNYLVAGIAYTIISYLTALITYIICRCLSKLENREITKTLSFTGNEQNVENDCTQNEDSRYSYQITDANGVSIRY